MLEGSDFIRGDLPIFPQNLGWFSPSVQPHIDLRKGIVDNYDKDTADQLKLLQMKSEGKFDRAFEGENGTSKYAHSKLRNFYKSKCWRCRNC